MDGDRFDGLSRRLARGVSRRDVLVGAAAGVLGALGLRARPADAAQVTQAQCGNVTCANNPGRCNPGCVCCTYTNSLGRVTNSRCRPPGTCSPGTTVCPPERPFVDPVLGCVACRGVADCPVPASPCQVAACAAGVCGAAPVADGSPGACPASADACTVNVCGATGGCELQNAANGTACAGCRLCQDGVCPPPAMIGPCEQPCDLCQSNVLNPQTGACVTLNSCFPDACEEVFVCNYPLSETNRANVICDYTPRNFGACDPAGGCPAGTTCCGGQCRNLGCDPTNCGECGYDCFAARNFDGPRTDRGNACAVNQEVGAGRCFRRADEARSPII